MTTQTQSIYLSLHFNQILELVKQLGADERQRLLNFLLNRSDNKSDENLSHFASEASLAKDWLSETENEAWQDL